MVATKTEFTVTGEQTIHCDSCEQRIARALRRLPGVLGVEAGADSQRVAVEFDAERVGDEELRERLDLLGYEVEGGAMSARPPETFVRPERAGGDGSAKLQLKVGGMHCSLCTESIHKGLSRLEGVEDARVSIAHEEALIHYDPARIGEYEIRETLADLGYTARDPDAAEIFAAEEEELAASRRKAMLSGSLLAAASTIKGVRAEVEGLSLAVGSPRLVEGEGADLSPSRERIEALQRAGNTVVVLAVDGEAAALIALADRIKDNA